MARKLRIQYEGALYHVINRGNYRRDVFESVGAAQAFEEVLIEACETHGWKLHAHVVMRNHYHLAVETPRANLVEGMHWLQSTFATRFNRLRQERGHLFQGRYQALLIEDAAALAQVVDYIHLNPVRAGIVPAEHLAGFRWSSLRRFAREGRPAVFCGADWLAQRGLADSVDGWQAYTAYLTGLAADEAEQKRRGLTELSKGWAIGSEGWRRAIAKDHAQRALSPGVEAGELKNLKEAHWGQVLEAELLQLGKTRSDAAEDIGGAVWKIALAKRLRREGAPHAWIAMELKMGKVSSVRAYLSRKSSK
ncbi:MAG TPA: transposase [Rariglobus sp.]|jgi:REP element-mobilizing transposase RayT|nr:transposase [Rariglobus sp.]